MCSQPDGFGLFYPSCTDAFSPLRVQTPEQQAEFDAVIAPLAEWDVTHQLQRLADRPLLLWHGQEDDVVPAVETFRLQQALIQAGLDNNLTCLWEAGVRHRITPEALAATVTFFASTFKRARCLRPELQVVAEYQG